MASLQKSKVKNHSGAPAPNELKHCAPIEVLVLTDSDRECLRAVGIDVEDAMWPKVNQVWHLRTPPRERRNTANTASWMAIRASLVRSEQVDKSASNLGPGLPRPTPD
jgi:hypothetical protein